MVDDTQDFIKALQEAPNTDMPFGVDAPKPVGQMANMLANKVQTAWSLPQRFMEASGQDLANLGDPQRTELASTQPAMETAQMMMGRMPFAPKGAAGLFGGRLAAGADRAALQRAQHLEGMGMDAERNYRENSWYRDPADQQWKFEIPDKGMKLNYFPASEGDTAYSKLGQIIQHPEAFKQYPHLKDINISLTLDKSRPQGAGMFDPDNGIQVLAPDMKTARSVIAHEMQHAIQHHEGNFAYGSDPEWLRQSMEEGFQRNPNLLKQGVTQQQALDQANPLYWNHAGEVEARNVQNRLDWDAGRRKLLMPTMTQGTPLRDQIYYNPRDNIIRALRGQ